MSTVAMADVAEVSGPDLTSRVDALVGRGRRLRAESAELGDLLHERIGLLDVDDTRRSALVAVRRSVHHLRPPPERLLEAVAGAPGELLSRRIARWSDDVVAADADLGDLDARLADDADARWSRLRHACDDPRFRTAVGSVSPSLSLVLESWLDDVARRPRRRSLLTLLRYLARAAGRSSPLSAFTAVLLGTLEHGATGAPVRAEAGLAASALEVDCWSWDAVLGLVVAGEAPTLALDLVVNPTLERDGDSLRYLRPGWQEQWCSVAATPVLLASWRAVEAAGAAGEAQVAALLAEAAGREPRDVVPLLRRLVGAGVLHAHPRTTWPTVVADPAPATAAGAEDALGEAIGRLARDLEPLVDVARVPELRARARRHLDDVVGRVGGTSQAGPRREVLRDTLVAGPGSVHLAGAAWGATLADLDLAAAWTSLLDPLLGYRLVLGELVRRDVGAGGEVGLLALHRLVEHVLAAGAEDDLLPFLRPDHVGREDLLLGSDLPALRRLGERRAAWRAALVSAAAPTCVEGRTVLRVDPARLRLDLATAPPVHVVPPTVTCYVQPYVDDGTRVVLTTVHGGDGRGRSRWTHLTSAPFPPPPARDDGGAEAVELDGTWGSNLNLRSAVTRRAIGYPGAAPSRTAACTIALTDLRVGHDERSGLPVLRDADGSTLRVAHTGMMTEAVVPSLARLLVGGFGTSYLQHAATPVVPPPEPDGSGVGHRARVEVGRVVLAREAWTVPARDVPRTSSAEGEGAFLLRLAAWADDHGLPRHVFVRIASERRGDDVLGNDHKPLYVDLRQVGLVLLLERLVADADDRRLLVEEALPVPGRTGLGDETPSAVEIVLERRLDRPSS